MTLLIPVPRINTRWTAVVGGTGSQGCILVFEYA